MKNIIILMFVAITTTGCGVGDRMSAGITGHASEVCHDGVLYLQFLSGASVAYSIDGTIKTCGPEH